ncbi:hypothetical protein BDF14DRAFT_1868149 [Spinellus fusiger]|nr:hypothetical protein BDF14DRAFT_1868149 [Spinellus fusiger]
MPPKCDVQFTTMGRIKLHYSITVWGETEPYETTYGGDPREYHMGRAKIIKGLEQGLKDMCVGEIRRLLIPSDLAYGELGIPGIVPPNTALVYEIELVESTSPFRNKWFWIGLVSLVSSYIYFEKKSSAKDATKASKFLEKKQLGSKPEEVVAKKDKSA